MTGGSNELSIDRASTPIRAGSVQPVTSYGRSTAPPDGYSCRSSSVLMYERYGCARNTMSVPAGYETPPAVNGSDVLSISTPAARSNCSSLTAATTSCCVGGMTYANGDPFL